MELILPGSKSELFRGLGSMALYRHSIYDREWPRELLWSRLQIDRDPLDRWYAITEWFEAEWFDNEQLYGDQLADLRNPLDRAADGGLGWS
jgi:hypothetical protein